MKESEDTAAGEPLKDAVLIAGPTASGKSALALEVARRKGGVIVNADSMQVYSVLSVITARPRESDMAKAEHRLYGHVPPDRPYSTGDWLADVRGMVTDGSFGERKAVFVGGTGLYFRALTEGLSPMPEVAPEIRARWRDRLATEGPASLHTELARRDPEAAEKLNVADGQRLVRALEVLDASGRSIREWQARRSRPLVDRETARLVILEPERDLVVSRIEARFDRMIEQGALDEVRALLAMKIPASMPAMKAIGVPELTAYLRGETDLTTATAMAKAATRRYAKRQVTWLRNQMGADWRRFAMSGEDTPDSTYRRLCL